MNDPQRTTNNFDFLRLLAASLVVVGHSYWLCGRAADEPVRNFTAASDMADIAVNLFFVMSGFLIATSWSNSRSTLEFAGKRALRIFPALIVSVLFAVLVVGPVATKLPLIEYLSDPQTYAYLANALLITEFHLPGVFAGNPFPDTVNGSLWTLPYEVGMYASLMMLGLLRLFSGGIVLVLLAALIGIRFALMPALEIESVLLSKATRLALFFYAGCALYLYRDRIRWSWKLAVPLALLTIVTAGHQSWFLGHVLTLPYLVIYVAHLRLPLLAGAGKAGDFSYGLYIFSFPLQQLIMHWNPHLPLASFMILSLALSLAAAVLSWHLIESPALALKRYLPCGLKPPPIAVRAANRSTR